MADHNDHVGQSKLRCMKKLRKKIYKKGNKVEGKKKENNNKKRKT